MATSDGGGDSPQDPFAAFKAQADQAARVFNEMLREFSRSEAAAAMIKVTQVIRASALALEQSEGWRKFQALVQDVKLALPPAGENEKWRAQLDAMLKPSLPASLFDLGASRDAPPPQPDVDVGRMARAEGRLDALEESNDSRRRAEESAVNSSWKKKGGGDPS
ncbi:MAG: hypothetical protein M3R63_18475 [Actinomycetota bacterium]|nr:hypothetical protein [Actinomycetota bacterium]